MGAVKSLYADVCELLTTTELDEVEIATLLGADVELVTDIMHDMAYESERDGQPDEAQEWHDYDPDC
jgi:DNA-binding ferritin-like protein (Dps family)